MQKIRIDCIKQSKDEEKWISSLKIYLIGDVSRLSATEAKICAVIAPDYEVDQTGLLFYCPRSATESKDRTEVARSVFQSSYSKILAPLPHKFGGWSSRNWPYLLTDQGQLSLEWVVSKVCSGM